MRCLFKWYIVYVYFNDVDRKHKVIFNVPKNQHKTFFNLDKFIAFFIRKNIFPLLEYICVRMENLRLSYSLIFYYAKVKVIHRQINKFTDMETCELFSSEEIFRRKSFTQKKLSYKFKIKIRKWWKKLYGFFGEFLQLVILL